MTEYEKKIDRLYGLMERAKKDHDEETAATLRWAIYTLESMGR